MLSTRGIETPVGCLEGLTVVEVASGPAGAFCGRLLSMLGADVIKAELPRRGDPTRRWGPFSMDVPAAERSLLFQQLNLNKRGITLDTASPDGFELLGRLLGRADVLIVEGEQPRWTEDAIDTLHREHPELLINVMRPYGMTGPNKDDLAEGLNIFEAGGSGYLNPAGRAYFEHPDRQPLNLSGHTSDEYWGLVAAIGILAGVLARDEVGGQVIDASGQEAHLTISRQQISYYANDQMYETRETYHTAFAGCVPCKDGHVEMYIMSNPQWEGLLNMMGNPDWAKEERFALPSGRIDAGPEIDERLFEWTSTLTKKDIYKLAQKFGVPVGYFATPLEVTSIPQEQAREFFQAASHPVTGSTAFPLSFVKLSRTPPQVTRAAPLLGQHNREVYASLLGIPRSELTTLARLGVI